ncbi:5-guanidino-2-oxopentanoate decarboxylase [Aliiroseovarius lamellibrachiae]|uniref:5-guanidino-2-oxopentanoate decarboxylase n=1 Tax=Aliiroseovarius lamellibrachiae TaxID=1924933 RepID=UPI001BDFE170|nr:5-guanidino-2-oxopentanoate decarboxylase [Aliiroseovarius lamellibrachiae]MBT2130507.1 5-guanidino-2-oxopentanoate decarboxylase [Aliiroseovarius lamellibrachiae]
MTSIGEALVAHLTARGVDCVFGIPGVHTIELYRGLAASSIRHVTPRHEQGAGFMADGYARTSGKPGVAFVITGPGLTNTLTAMGQARADSVPMLVVSGVNATDSLGKGLGHLHELPDQQALARTVALVSERVECADDLAPALDSAFAPFRSGRPGPTHVEIPLDVAGAEAPQPPLLVPSNGAPPVDAAKIKQAVQMISNARAPVILAGGGTRHAARQLRAFAEKLGAPVVQTVNARGVLFDHPLGIPASPSLTAVRALIEASDLVLAFGTELGQTDYDMYATGVMPQINTLIRVDRCAEQLARHRADLTILGDTAEVLDVLTSQLAAPRANTGGAARAAQTRNAAFDELGPEMRALSEILNAARDAVPNAIFVGDSAYPIYAGNLYYDHDRPGGWFNAATGFGALGYGIPAAIGAAIAEPSARVICISGDGGAQFSLPEMMCAVDENLPITFVIWNNHGYQEIATSMQAVDVTVVGCDPTPPDFEHIANAHEMPFWRCGDDAKAIASALSSATSHDGPTLIEIRAPNVARPGYETSPQ